MLKQELERSSEPLASSLTVLLRSWQSNNPDVLDEIMRMVYRQLHEIAVGYLRHERKGHTLRPTALVHEAYLKLATAETEFQDRAHFLAIASMTMRQILVDYARRVASKKRGAAYQAQASEIAADEIAVVSGVDPEDMLALDEALTRLTRQDDRKGKLVELVYFGGLSQQEAALVLSVSIETVYRDMKFAKAWLRKELAGYREIEFSV